MECQLITNSVPTNYLGKIDGPFLVNENSIDNQLSIGNYKLTTNGNWLPIECQLITIGQLISYEMSIDYQCNTNRLPMDNW